MNQVLSKWNLADQDSAVSSLLSCCASPRWATAVAFKRPFSDEAQLFSAADQVWSTMEEPDWLEAFKAHPRIGQAIGEQKAAHGSEQSVTWSRQEQASTAAADDAVLAELAAKNLRYEELFGMTYIVCATGKSADQMLQILRERLGNDRETEMRRAVEEQRLILGIRLKKWLRS